MPKEPQLSILSPAANWRASHELLGLLSRHRQLTWEMVRRELTERFAGHGLGALWAIGHPIVTIAVFIFLYVLVFKQRMTAVGLETPGDFTVYMLAGLIPWLMMQEVLAKSTGAIIGNANLVKQVVFPVEILPVKIVLAAVVTQLVFLVVFVGYMLARLHTLPPTVLLVPVLMALQAVAAAGLALALSSLSCFLRDLREFVTVFCSINVFLMPVVYQPTDVPELLRPLLYVNPFSYMIWCWQDAMFFGRFEHPVAWVVFPLFAAACLALGARAFRKLKPQLGNVL
jgi:lipopolysaccharide transport system permease protein